MQPSFRKLLNGLAWTMLLTLRVALPVQAEPGNRIPWTNSQLRGSPEPPLPFVIAEAFPHAFTGPISLHRLPGSTSFLVLEQDGKILAFEGSQPTTAPRLLVDFNSTVPPFAFSSTQTPQRVQLFSLAFHPQFASNSLAYLCYITVGGNRPTETHISRFELQLEPELRLDVASELEVLRCEGGGHNGCTLAFGPEGLLYISLGDLEVPTPPDPRDTGQDISDLYASILRIDVDRPSHGNNYGIPEDNPFIHLPTARPEVYAYGLRNPFRMAFDAATGDLWVGDVGWEAWEMVYRVRAGGNYGWAIKEGPGDVKPQRPGPTPILPPDIALGHSQAASVTGGMVYRGSRLPSLTGTYIFGDWITRKFWSARFDAERVLETREIAVGNVKPICFEVDADGELLILEYGEANQPGRIYRLQPNPALQQPQGDFPRRLSETGLFTDTRQRRPAPGVAEYHLQAPMWADGARAEFMLAVPDQQQVVFHQQPQKTFNWFRTKVELPIGSVLVKTYLLPSSAALGRTTERAETTAASDWRPVETQLSLKDSQGEWQYYSYRWNERGDDAELVDAAGLSVQLDWAALPQADTPRRWHFASRSSCRICHTPWTGETVGFVEWQLRGAASNDSWHALAEQGLITARDKPLADDEFSGLVDPYDAQQPLDRRARSYLHANCAHCHLQGGNASTVFDVSFDKALANTQLIDTPPMRGALGIPEARLVQAGRPEQSILLYRLAKAGAGRMPHVGAAHVDLRGVQLLQAWISHLSPVDEHREWLDQLCAPQLQRGQTARRLAAAERLLGSVSGSLLLAGAFAERAVPTGLRSPIVDLAMQQPAGISELFEPYAAASQIPTRLGNDFEVSQVLELAGDAERGRTLFQQGLGSCSACHRVEGVGVEVGPAFAQSAKRYATANQLLEQITQPSLAVAPEYQAVSMVTADGQVLTGRIMDESTEEVVLIDAQGKTHTLPTDDVVARKPSPTSLMPAGLLAPLTAQQTADLLAYILSCVNNP